MKRTTLCYIKKDNKYLMLYRNKKENDINHDKWIGIGGKIEDGETPGQCLLREVKEETGLTLNSYLFRGIVHFVSDVYENEDMYLYTSEDFSGELIPCDEGELKWIDRDKLYDLTLWEGDKIFLGLIRADAEFFDLTVEYKGDKLISASIGEEIIFRT
ncbi:MAG: 8-oxo-dGTP diphosphatase [Clostridia bacterium]|nr:8-oxo-dGTP diphosphatase [Clostridia bacterium]